MSNQIETNQSIQNIREDTKELSERLDRINGKMEMNAKNQSINFKDLESRMAAITRPHGALPSNTQQNPKQNQGSNNGQKYTPPTVRQEQAKAITTRTGRSYDPPPNPNVIVSDVQDTGDNDEAEVNEEIEMEDSSTVKTPVTPPKPAGMPNYAKFIKELVTDKGKMDEVKVAYLNAECSAILQNQQIPPKLEDPGSFLITCSIRSLTCKALADLGASINLKPYSVWSRAYCLVDFVILEMEEDTKVPLILRRPFFNTADTIIRVKDKENSFGVGTDRIVFNVERSIKHSYSTDESCFKIDVIDDALDQEFEEFIETEVDEELTRLGDGDIDDELFAEVMALSLDETPPEDENFERVVADGSSRVPNSVDVPPTDVELKPLPAHLEYVYLADKMLTRRERTHLVLNWEKCHFMVTEGIVMGHKVSKAGIEVDRAKIDVIAKLPPPSNVKGVLKE
uniref:uncharacterized protein LOC122591618 n=1 Tax=Erigeron canadensis TaxID=72917 RepID=UPI001CB9AC7D|nr:uncharacterized protein LOC122591618 [Erigeron canadensis]